MFINNDTLMRAVEPPRPSVTSQEVFSGHFAEGSVEQRQFNAQAAQDWETFLSYRSKELVPGMVLALAMSLCFSPKMLTVLEVPEV